MSAEHMHTRSPLSGVCTWDLETLFLWTQIMQNQHGMKPPRSWLCAESVKAREERSFSKKKKGEAWLLYRWKMNTLKILFCSLINKNPRHMLELVQKGERQHSPTEQRDWTANQGKTYFGGCGSWSVPTLSWTEKKSNAAPRPQTGWESAIWRGTWEPTPSFSTNYDSFLQDHTEKGENQHLFSNISAVHTFIPQEYNEIKPTHPGGSKGGCSNPVINSVCLSLSAPTRFFAVCKPKCLR